MENKYIITIIAVIIIISAIMVVITNNNSQNRPNDELVVCIAAHGGEPESGFNPMTGWGKRDDPLIQSTLFKYDSNATLINDLATSYNISDDLKTYTVNIREGIKFTDESPLTAEDVVFTYNKAKESGETTNLESLDNAQKVNDTTIQFTLNRPDSTFINKLAHVGIVPSDSYNNITYGENPIGSGPYKLKQWDKGQQVIFERNEDYYGKKPYYRKITNVYLDAETAFVAAKNGEIDVVEVPVTYLNSTIEGMHTQIMHSIDGRYLSLPVMNNTEEKTVDGKSYIGNDITSDSAIREALMIGINRTNISQGAYNGLADPLYDVVSSSLPWSLNSSLSDGDITQAKEILASNGWVDSDGDGIVEKDGKKASFNLNYGSNDQDDQIIALSVSQQAKDFGIEIIPQSKQWSEIRNIKSSEPFVFSGGDLDPYMLYQYYSSSLAGKGWNNVPGYNNPQVDKLMENAMNIELNSSYDSWKEVDKLAKKDNPYIPLATKPFLLFVSDRVDISPNTQKIYPHGGDFLGNIYDWKHNENNTTVSNETTSNNTTS
ncbi:MULTISPECIES: ABC transporter substrate-binding protein [Methanosphaera]|uniref:Solute-binding protein family 5 domain-containing protein n=2 Tax=Methanosphaera TaxID=2316 RepID=A0A328Q686_9EURY|nr:MULTISPECIES: ABC transporter substrate-binding protein [Methanosphaera]RAP03096.1 hypothetical protein CA615_04235 [Methanosphaera stadtmanae]RAP47281.1 MAG: hypothetical protein BZ132_04115 [Methanosphaera sp. DEW79]